MRPNISLAFRQGANAQHDPDGIYILVTVEHEELAELHHLTNAPTEIMSRDIPFLPMPMEITLSEDSEDRPPQAKLVMANVDRRLVAALRSTNQPCSIMLEVVRISDPNYVEASFADFSMRDVQYDALTIEGTLSLEGMFEEPAIDYCFTPSFAPGLF
jgi:hypothetical protein